MNKHAYALIAALILSAAPAFGQGWNVERISESYETWYGTNCLAKQGDCVYLRTNYGDLSIIDVSDPEDPIEVARSLDGYSVSDIDVAGNYAYIALHYYGGINYGGLKILDISNPSNPTEVAHISPPRLANYTCIAGNIAYLVYPLQPQGNGMYMVDITDPAHPEIVGHCLLPGNAGEPSAVDSFLYIPMQTGGLWIYDISDPLLPVQVGSISIPEGYCYGVAVSEGVAYLPMTMNGLAILDVSLPSHPTILSQIDFDSWTRAIDVVGNLAYAGTDRDGLYILDVTQPLAPVILGNYAGPYPHGILGDLVVEGATVFGAWNEMSLRITDVSDPQNPTEISSYYAHWTIADVAYRDNCAYLAAAEEGLLIEDVSDPAQPWQVSYLNDLGGVYDVLLHGNYAYLYTSPGLKIADISDPAHPFLAATYNLPGVIRKFVGNLAYAGALPDLQILDMSSPLNPTPVGYYDLPQGGIGNFDTDGSYLYAIAYYEGHGSTIDSLLVLNVSNPANPQFVALHPFGIGILVLGEGFLYVAGSDNQFRVYNVSDPAQPAEVGQLSLPMNPCDIALEGDFVYISSEGMMNSGPRIIDVSDPANPIQTGYYNAPAAYTQYLAVNAGYAYFTEDGRLVIYDCRDAAHNDVNVTLTALLQPIQIPASGGGFDYYFFAQNNGPGNQTLGLWTKVILPGGSVLSPIMGPVSVSLDSGTTGWIRHQSVPGRAAAGSYTYIACAGIYPNIWASDTLQFTKLASGDWGPGSGDWFNTGESFEIAHEEVAIPNSSFIISARPNPFNPSTAISYQLSANSHVELKVFDISGRLVATLVDGWREAGVHEVTFDGASLPSGIYLAKITTNGGSQTQKLVLMK